MQLVCVLNNIFVVIKEMHRYVVNILQSIVCIKWSVGCYSKCRVVLELSCIFCISYWWHNSSDPISCIRVGWRSNSRQHIYMSISMRLKHYKEIIIPSITSRHSPDLTWNILKQMFNSIPKETEKYRPRFNFFSWIAKAI